MEISKRLQGIANYVPKGTQTVADIGTDHGYIPIYLIKNKIAQYCIACDVNPMPLNNAKTNINHHQMNDYIKTRLSDGLAQIKKGEVDVITIAGMGGMLIIDILKEDLGTVKDVGLLILQPQLDIQEVRRYLHQIEFMIIDETMVYEDGKYYTIIVSKPGKETTYSQTEYMLGKSLLEKKDPILKKSLEEKINNLMVLLDNIGENDKPHVLQRINEINSQITIYKEVLKCLQE